MGSCKCNNLILGGPSKQGVFDKPANYQDSARLSWLPS